MDLSVLDCSSNRNEKDGPGLEKLQMKLPVMKTIKVICMLMILEVICFISSSSIQLNATLK